MKEGAEDVLIYFFTSSVTQQASKAITDPHSQFLFSAFTSSIKHHCEGDPQLRASPK